MTRPACAASRTSSSSEGDRYTKGDLGEVEFLCSARSDIAVEAVTWQVRFGDTRTRALVVENAWRHPHPKILDALPEAMAERASYAEIKGEAARVCDRAARSIARMLRRSLRLAGEPRAHNVQLDRLAAWVEERRASIPWTRLAK